MYEANLILVYIAPVWLLLNIKLGMNFDVLKNGSLYKKVAYAIKYKC
jgi:hypothetical protein